ncbi:hypothetical protein [Dictyobacter arantiisoli]|uniref:Uncharacterized protein n=1 Tax=Dictyobacter arantiisoli TaxID=2014874 RepID=A0A5A5TDT5_9CHLR|nr:hypothetical protein [Dictyobacter arantiisoli]GCF09385.1 hypothetical protein KDI_29490 [Dictyobacter arantiisoli]
MRFPGFRDLPSASRFNDRTSGPTVDIDARLTAQLDRGAFPEAELTALRELTEKQRDDAKAKAKLYRPMETRETKRQLPERLDRALAGDYLKEIATLTINKADKAIESIKQRCENIQQEITDARTELTRLTDLYARDKFSRTPDTEELKSRISRVENNIVSLEKDYRVLEENLKAVSDIRSTEIAHLEDVFVDVANKEVYQQSITTNFERIAAWLERRQITNDNLQKNIDNVKKGQNYWMNGDEKTFFQSLNSHYMETQAPQPDKIPLFDKDLGHTYSAEHHLDDTTLATRKVTLDTQYADTTTRWDARNTTAIETTENVEKQIYVGHLSDATILRAQDVAQQLMSRPTFALQHAKRNKKTAEYLKFVIQTPRQSLPELQQKLSMKKIEPHEEAYLREAENKQDLYLVKDMGRNIAIEVFKSKMNDPIHAERLANIRRDEERCMVLHNKLYETLVQLEHDPMTQADRINEHINNLQRQSQDLLRDKVAFHNDNVETANAIQQGVRDFIHHRFYQDLITGKFRSMEQAIKSWANYGQNIGQTLATLGVGLTSTSLTNDALSKLIGNAIGSVGTHS